MARQRMYLFERAYLDYGTRIRGFGSKLWESCANIWNWFWSGPGGRALDVILRVSVIIVAILLCILYVRYEDGYGRGFSWGTLVAIAVIFVFASIVLWGWKAPIHFAARLLAGASASGLILILSVAAILLALAAFSSYLLLLFALTALSFVIFLPMRAGQELSLLYRRVTYRCPYDDCSGQGLPIHICLCGQQYPDLLPSFYGIFHHICWHNGRAVKLPTMDFLGRNKLPRLCGTCKRPLVLSSIGELSERPVAIVGGPSAGKTVFLRQATRQLSERLSALPNARVYIDSQEQEQTLKQDLTQLDRGQVVSKTAGNVIQAFGLAVRIPKKRVNSLLYLYDAPGEHFLTMERFGQKQVLRHLAGIVLLVDPFSLPGLSDHAHRLDAGLQPSEIPFYNIVTVLINGVNQMLVRRPIDKCDVPLAVVISKADALPWQDLPFLADLGQSQLIDLDGSLYSAHCREALEKLGEGRSIRALEQKFSNVQYFACSALGRMPDGRNTAPFQPLGVAEPFLWLLQLNVNGNNPGGRRKSST